jgi:predicted outer membrane lipoprotein|tara:strand:+ start:175 stop:354 length:180 start_codon:yes stop_codon:yes gene_type:complete
MKEYQLLIGLGLVALALYFGISNATWTEYESCMKYEQLDSRGALTADRAGNCWEMLKKR